MNFERARKIADAVLYEGYVLYPYRASAPKNRFRRQFGVLAPRVWSEAGGCEPWWMQTECLLQTRRGAQLACKVRFLRVQRRAVERRFDDAGVRYEAVENLELDVTVWTVWEEAVEREVDFARPLLRTDRDELIQFDFPGDREIEPIRGSNGREVGRVVRERCSLRGLLRFGVDALDGVRELAKLRVRIENITGWDAPSASRSAAVQASMAGVHTLLGVSGGAFVSLLDPPAWAQHSAAACANVRAYPVPVGEADERDAVLSSPIILYDYPQIAPESPGDFFDAAEIDELLTLRTMALTDDEKRKARSTDPRAAAVVERADTMPAEMLERLHGAVRYGRQAAAPAPAQRPLWRDPGADSSVAPEIDSLEIADVAVSQGSRVLLRPGRRNADAQDMFFAGKMARVEGVFADVDNRSYLAVSVENDPAAELYRRHGRFLYFYPDEVEPLGGPAICAAGSWWPASATFSSAMTASELRLQDAWPRGSFRKAWRSETLASAASIWHTSCGTAATR